MKRAPAVVALALSIVLTGGAIAIAESTPPATTSYQLCGAAATHIGRTATCLAERAAGLSERAGSAPAGLSPAQLRAAYNLPAASARVTVAVVSAYNDPRAASDLAVYRHRFGLTPCTTANHCFRKVNQTGGANMPKFDAGWAGETSLDIEMISAACGQCRILLVEANTSSMGDLATAVDYAATQKVAAISNSYAGGDSSHAAAYDHPGIAVVAAAGDTGYGAAAPASYRSVIAVGGTTLTRARNARGWAESAWSAGGSRCVTSVARPAWQGAGTRCAGNAVSDVSAVADPATGVAAYIGTPYAHTVGWQVMGGTSVAAPIIAGVYALSGRTHRYPAAYTWAHRSALNDVTRGTNGRCRRTVWCHAGVGWDGPTGLGTPNGIGAF